MRWEETSNQVCSVARATSIFGDRWTLIILRQLFLGMRKFSDIQQALGITKHRLADRLGRLTDENIVFKYLYDERYKRYEYRLTEKGVDLYAVILTIGQWGDKWASDNDGPPVEYVHTECKQVAKPKLVCGCCGDDLTPHNLKVRMGPGLKKKHARDELSDQDIKLYSIIASDI
ncbi:MAG: helix-turn-helix domain-containing protein [Paraglaciecola sp.]|uniref:winged helix-turn-helix transcriptional regulator n=1 Tax=Paraglaciecola sp. TaxID=1920173 RepID=UPI0032633212